MQNKFLSNRLINTSLVMEFSSNRLKNGVSKTMLLQNQPNTTVFVEKYINLYQITFAMFLYPNVIIFHGVDILENCYIFHH